MIEDAAIISLRSLKSPDYSYSSQWRHKSMHCSTLILTLKTAELGAILDLINYVILSWYQSDNVITYSKS